jgi:hypothetical protein
MSEKVSDPEWVIESFVPGIGWSLSRLNDGNDAHSLDWCMDQWNRFKSGEMLLRPGFLTDPYRYRLRNVGTEDILMCAIL